MKESFIFQVILFSIFLIPFSISLGGDGLSANYLFILYPIINIIFFKKIVVPKINFLIIIYTYALIFLVAFFYQYDYYSDYERRLVSFIIFMSQFIFIFIKINKDMIRAFKASIVLISTFYSLVSIINYISLGGDALGFSAKGDVGSQRYGFVYIVAIWILLCNNLNLKKYNKYFLIAIISYGLLLTFSRSGIIAIIATFILFFINQLKIRKNLFNLKDLNKYLPALLFTTLIIVSLYQFAEGPIRFFEQRLFALNLGNDVKIYDFINPEASEGYRLYLFKLIIDFVFNNPLTGSGFLGVWILFDDKSGSAHNQYLDILFRTGFIGFVLYLYILYRILKYLYWSHKDLFWGFLGVLVYGIFHETFKMSQGAFIFAFLLGIFSSSLITMKEKCLKK